jgi:hypothetical protein
MLWLIRRPAKMTWGRLHDFAFDSMRFALERWNFTAITVVDLDLMLVRPGIPERLRKARAESTRYKPARRSARQPFLTDGRFRTLPGPAGIA